MATQSTGEIWMVRPDQFQMNEQTAVNNHYQHSAPSSIPIAEIAYREFDAMVEALLKFGIHVHLLSPSAEEQTPDAVFPNNWISFHPDQTCALYPMFAENRRLERNRLSEILQVHPRTVRDWSGHESEGRFLEGTGSLVLDRIHRIAFAALSDRTHAVLVEDWCRTMQYTPILFRALQSTPKGRLPIYHTNVMMSIGTRFSVVCLESIDNRSERQLVQQTLAETHREIITLTEMQIDHFAGNLLELTSPQGPIVVISTTGWQALSAQQQRQLESHAQICAVDIPTIERYGGGSARCMIAEVF